MSDYDETYHNQIKCKRIMADRFYHQVKLIRHDAFDVLTSTK